MKYKGFNILEIEKKKGLIYQLDMTIDGKRVRRNFSSLQEAKSEASKQAEIHAKSLESSPITVNDQILDTLDDLDVSLEELTNFYIENKGLTFII